MTFLVATPLYAKHIKGGWIQYEYFGTGSTATSSYYRVTIHLFASCNENGPTDQVFLGVFDKSKNEPIFDKRIPVSEFRTVSKTKYDPCLNYPPEICYRIFDYSTIIELENNENGYILAAQDALRSAGIVNIQNSSNRGISFQAIIPGLLEGNPYYANSSPFFEFRDTVIICYNAPFTYQFTASDPNGDSLSYFLGDGLDVRAPSGNTSSIPPANPPYPPIKYQNGFSGSQPMGEGIAIDNKTGLISGIAPSVTGDYVIAVYVNEYRNGLLLGSTKKELQVNVSNCSLTAADLKSAYINCDDFYFQFQNESAAPNIFSYNWDFGVTNSNTDTSTKPTPEYTYADTGTFKLRLIVKNTGGCVDTAEAPVKVYPGFKPDFQILGSCYETPFQFRDMSISTYGKINSWSWDFGDLNTTSDISSAQNATYKYSTPGNRTVVFKVGDSNGCTETQNGAAKVSDQPLIELPFRDTLLCSIDSLVLVANSFGNFSWSPDANMKNAQTSRPTVFPKQTTIYTVRVTDGICTNLDSIKVNVVDAITIDAGNDIELCSTDSVMLNPISQGLLYTWTPASSLSNATIKNPKAAPQNTSTYYVTASVGSCKASDSLRIYVSPYPQVNAGADTTICYGAMATLNGTHTGVYFQWETTASLINTRSFQPIASPTTTTSYVMLSTDTSYCKKPARDTVTVFVRPEVKVFAGRDTSVVIGQPLPLQGTGGASYEWYPTDYLSNPNIADPVFNANTASDGLIYQLTAYNSDGCSGNDDILIKVFSTGTDIFVPSGFTPNGDGKNDIAKPILVGIKSLNYFRIYNRYGKLVYNTTTPENGWDGKINGQQQATGTYVYVTEGTDYTGKKIIRKGTIVLIR